MSSKTVSRFDLKGVIHHRVVKGETLDKAISKSIKEAANHAVGVFDQTGDISAAVSSMGLESPEALEAKVRELTPEQSVTRTKFLASVLQAVGSGGITSIPTASCLYRYLPHDRKPTKEEMEEAWQKCSHKAATATP